jgi:putative two-component system response regulator
MAGEKIIFAVDDIPENLTAIRNTLKDQYNVYPCPSAFKMFELLENKIKENVKPDLIMLDVGMPDMDGYEAIKKLKSDDRFNDVPVIFLSAMSDEQSEMEGLKLGAVDYIHKPFVTPLLLQRVKIHLSMSEQKQKILNRNKEIEDFLKKISNNPI